MGSSGVSYGRDPLFVEIAVLSTESTILAKSVYLSCSATEAPPAV